MRRATRLARLLLAVLLGGCAGAGAWPASSVRLQITVEEPSAGDRWAVRYRFSKPVRGVVFPRDVPAIAQAPAQSRSAVWQITAPRDEQAAPAASWTSRGGRDAILFTDDRERREIRIAAPGDYGLRQDYLFHVRFADVGQLLYTGPLTALPLVGEQETTPPPGMIRWRFRTARTREIRVLDRARKGRLDWKPPPSLVPGDGTYVFFGNLTPLETDRMLALIDPTLPDWSRAVAEDLLPRLFDHYATLLAMNLDARPLVLLSRLDDETAGMGATGRVTKGGTLHRVIQLALGGPGWAADSPEARFQLQASLAHETFHLWNGQLFRRRLGRHDKWLSEGSATFLAYKTLLELERIDPDRLETLVVEAANGCILELEGLPLAAGNVSDAALYDCGAVVSFLVDSTVRMATEQARGLGDVLGGVFHYLTPDGQYSRFDLLESLQLWAGAEPVTAPLERLLHAGVADGIDEFFEEQLTAAGLPVERVPVSEAELGNRTPPETPHRSYSALLRRLP